MIICEHIFNRLDPKNPSYSHTEWDFYAWIPAKSDLPDHRLTLRKNMKTGEYEVYRYFNDTKVVKVVLKTQSFEEAIRFADEQRRRFHGHWEPSQVCQHKPPVKAVYCPVWDQIPNGES